VIRLYDAFFASLYDRALQRAEAAGLRALRRELLAGAHGRTLEIGAGTGLNIEHYSAAVTRLVLTDPSRPMLRLLRRKADGMGIDAGIVDAPAERLPFERESFATVVATMVLCTTRDPAAAVREVARVLVPEGRFFFIEHVRSSDPALARWRAGPPHGVHRVRPLPLRDLKATGLTRTSWMPAGADCADQRPPGAYAFTLRGRSCFVHARVDVREKAAGGRIEGDSRREGRVSDHEPRAVGRGRRRLSAPQTTAPS
jgi:SAM-dependent methyltransferase